MNTRKHLSYLCGVLACLVCLPLSAAIVEFSDRASWRAAAGSIISTEDFESFVVDTPYTDTAPLVLASGMTLTSVSFGDNNFIDVPPHDNSESNVNGTTSMRANNSSTPIILFSGPVSAWGADSVEFQDDQVRTTVELYLGGNLVDSVVPTDVPSPALRFFGVAATAGETFDEIRFVNTDAGDTFGFDNVEIGARSTIVPALNRWGFVAMILMLTLVGGLALRSVGVRN